MKKNTKHSLLFEELVVKSWWAVVFFLLCSLAYDQAIKRRNREENQLRNKFESLQQKKIEGLAQQEELKRQIASQNDESWIELTLMRRLGLVPEGQTKVHFIPQ
ncbi:MAG: hypothetical protein WAM28_03345 [Chlamydiales bacterium]